MEVGSSLSEVVASLIEVGVEFMEVGVYLIDEEEHVIEGVELLNRVVDSLFSEVYYILFHSVFIS